MRGILKRAARLLLTAGFLGLPGLAAAQEVLLPPIESVPPTPANQQRSATEIRHLPQILPPEITLPDAGTVPSNPSSTPPTPQPPAPARTRSRPGAAVFATDRGGQAIDLLAVPTVPSTWAADTLKSSGRTARKTPKALPSALTVPSQPARKDVDVNGKFVQGSSTVSPQATAQTTEVTQIPTLRQVPTSEAEPASLPAEKSTPKKAVAWAAQRKTPPAKTNEWPAAFVENERPVAPVAMTTATKEAEKVESPPIEFKGPITASILHQKVAKACGGLAKDVKIIVRPDRSFAVQIQPVNASAERELLDRLLKLPEITSPNVHLEVDLVQ